MHLNVVITLSPIRFFFLVFCTVLDFWLFFNCRICCCRFFIIFPFCPFYRILHFVVKCFQLFSIIFWFMQRGSLASIVYLYIWYIFMHIYSPSLQQRFKNSTLILRIQEIRVDWCRYVAKLCPKLQLEKHRCKYVCVCVWLSYKLSLYRHR